MVTTVDELADQLGGLAGKRVLVRSDLNVPLDGAHHHRRRPDPGQRPDDRGPAARGARVVVMAHLGRPKGGPRDNSAYSLAPVGARLGELLGRRVTHATDTVGESATGGGRGDGRR